MANLHCPCGRLLHDTRALYCPTCLFRHYSQQQSHIHRYTGDRFTLPDRPKSTSNTPPSPPSHSTWQHSNSRKSMDSSAASTRPSSSSVDTNPLSPLSRPRHMASQHSSLSSISSASSLSTCSRRSSTSPPTTAPQTQNDSVHGAYSPIAAGFVRLSRSKDNSFDSSSDLTGLARGRSPVRNRVELEAARMFAGPA